MQTIVFLLAFLTILQQLPSVKSVMQKDRRQPSVLYCPKACEEIYGQHFHDGKL